MFHLLPCHLQALKLLAYCLQALKLLAYCLQALKLLAYCLQALTLLACCLQALTLLAYCLQALILLACCLQALTLPVLGTPLIDWDAAPLPLSSMLCDIGRCQRKRLQWLRYFNAKSTFATSCPALNGSSCDWAQTAPPESGEAALLFPLPDSGACWHIPWRTPGQRCLK